MRRDFDQSGTTGTGLALEPVSSIVQRFRFLPEESLAECDTRSENGLDTLIYFHIMIEEDGQG